MQSQRKPRPINLRFIVRGLIVALVLIIVALVGVSFLPPEILARLTYFWLVNQPAPVPPPPPTLTVPRGDLPSGPVGLQESAQYAGGALYAVGSGFLLQLEGGPVIGVTTAHSVGLLGSPPNALQKVAFSVAGQPDLLVTFDRLYGPPGVPRFNDNLVLDYVLLKLPDPVPALDSKLLLRPDDRGAPQPGERVVLFSGLGDGQGAPRSLRGTVLSADDQGVWVVMDEAFDAGGMSGSPLISEHTGRVVGMAMAVMYRRGHTLVGFHPIGSLVRHAQAAVEFPLITDFRR
jgi:hypothetical protein